MIVCGGKTRGGGTCQQKAGWGTQHVGEGRCKLHGGNAGRPIIHGRYSQYLPQAIAEKVASFDNDDPLNLLPELNVQRALFAEYISRFQAGYILTAGDISLMMDWATEISRTGERINKMRNETALTVAEVKFLAARIADVVAKYVEDPETQRAFVAELFGATGTSRRLVDSSG